MKTRTLAIGQASWAQRNPILSFRFVKGEFSDHSDRELHLLGTGDFPLSAESFHSLLGKSVNASLAWLLHDKVEKSPTSFIQSARFHDAQNK